MDTHPKQALFFHTHLLSEKILAHFQRLQHELCETMPVHLSFHAGDTPAAPTVPEADFIITTAQSRQLLPARYFEMERAHSRGYASGFPDLAYMPALLDPRTAPYEFLWFMEYDVDFAGNWADFFQQVNRLDADLIGTTLLPRSEDPHWMHWPWFEPPADVAPALQVRSFLPIARYSRCLLNRYHEAAKTGLWRGHSEAILPTLANTHGYRLHDLGGTSRWHEQPSTPWYHNTPHHPYLTPGTFVYRPPIHDCYYHENPFAFTERNQLYHPIKTEAAPKLAAMRLPTAPSMRF